MTIRTQFSGFARHFGRSQSGNIAIMAGFCMPILVGFCGFGVDTAAWFYRARQLHAAADIAAFNATVAMNAGASGSALTTAATTAASANGWQSANGTITVNTPPTSGSHETTNSIEVILTETVPRYFTSIYSSAGVTIQARAVGTRNGSHVACVIALSTSASPGISVGGSGNLSSTNCDVVADSTTNDAIGVSGSGSLTVPCAVSVGSSTMSSGVHLSKCTTMTNGAPPATDPYASVPEPSIPGACQTVANKQTSFSPGYYCNGISINWSNAVTFQPGVYYISGGGLTINGNATVSGTGVTFYLASGNSVHINGGANATITAPTSGTYSGVAFFGDRSDTTSAPSFNGGSGQVVTGVMYFPGQNVTYAGHSASASTCTQIVANTVTVTGNADFQGTCTGDGMSTSNVADGAPGSVALTE
ncbi:MAG TPA: pilus assembly protein TadG-related protein [Micropepsaceae bacterium]|nr:pilus assembly protein TadG-related protein [Micropepsaceae bacterium]